MFRGLQFTCLQERQLAQAEDAQAAGARTASTSASANAGRACTPALGAGQPPSLAAPVSVARNTCATAAEAKKPGQENIPKQPGVPAAAKNDLTPQTAVAATPPPALAAGGKEPAPDAIIAMAEGEPGAPKKQCFNCGTSGKSLKLCGRCKGGWLPHAALLGTEIKETASSARSAAALCVCARARALFAWP